MKKWITFYIILLSTFCSMQTSASESREKMYLIQLINQIEAMKPLIIAAEREQPKNLRIQFHYSKYRDASNKMHHGLLEDINEIEKSINDKLNQSSFEPHRFINIKDDYVYYEK